MKTLTKYLNEKLVINKYYKNPYTCNPASWEELRKIIEDRYDKLGAGTKDMPIDFNDVDVSNIDSFYNKDNDKGIFGKTKFEYIDISNWNVSNVEDLSVMFQGCEQLKSVGDLSDWNVSKVEDMFAMFCDCINLKSVGDLSNLNVSNVKSMNFMFYECKQLKSIGDLSDWNVSNVKSMNSMFFGCEQLKSVGDLSNWSMPKIKIISRMFYGCTQLKSVGDLSNWDVSDIKDKFDVFDNSGITNIPKWYK